MLFSVSVTRTLPPGAPSRHASCCRRCLGVENHSWLKPLSYFQFSSPRVMQARLQLVWLTSRCVCAAMCVCACRLSCVNVKEPRAKVCGLKPPSPELRFLPRSYIPFIKWPVAFPCQAVRGSSPLLTNQHSAVQACFCWWRPRRLDVADALCYSMHFPLPSLHHCGALCWCFGTILLHWCLGKIRFSQGSVQEQVPALVRITQRCWQDWILHGSISGQLILLEVLCGFLSSVSVVLIKWLDLAKIS